MSLSHSARTIEPSNIQASQSTEVLTKQQKSMQTNERTRKKKETSTLEFTTTDWKSQVALIRKNNNIVNKRRKYSK